MLILDAIDNAAADELAEDLAAKGWSGVMRVREEELGYGEWTPEMYEVWLSGLVIDVCPSLEDASALLARWKVAA